MGKEFDRVFSKGRFFLTLCFVLACTSNNSAKRDPQSASNNSALESGEFTQEQGVPEIDPGLSPLKRITNSQYNRIVQDVLGHTARPADKFASESFQNGFNNDTSNSAISGVIMDQYFQAAEEVSSETIQNRFTQIQNCNFQVKGESTCVKEFIQNIGGLLFRRFMSESEVSKYVSFYQSTVATAIAGEDKVKLGHQQLLKRFLLSAEFIYKLETTGNETPLTKIKLSPYELASRMSFFIWNSVPDRTLLDAAKNGELDSIEKIKVQAKRMLEDPRAKVGVEEFYVQWLGLIKLGSLVRDPSLYEGFDWTEIQALMVEEAKMVLGDIFWKHKNFSQLFGSNYTYVNETLGNFYGYSGIRGNGFSKYDLDINIRKGVLGLGAISASNAARKSYSPTQRGIFVYQTLLCQTIEGVPRNVNPVLPPSPAGVVETTRERFAPLQVQQPCATCHQVFDPIGNTLGSFNAVGRYQTQEFGKPIDTKVKLNAGDLQGDVSGVSELSDKMNASAAFPICVSKKLLQYGLAKRDMGKDEKLVTDVLAKGLTQKSFDPLFLIEQIVLSDSFRFRKAEGL